MEKDLEQALKERESDTAKNNEENDETEDKPLKKRNPKAKKTNTKNNDVDKETKSEDTKKASKKRKKAEESDAEDEDEEPKPKPAKKPKHTNKDGTARKVSAWSEYQKLRLSGKKGSKPKFAKGGDEYKDFKKAYDEGGKTYETLVAKMKSRK